jgi:thioredoxin 1
MKRACQLPMVTKSLLSALLLIVLVLARFQTSSAQSDHSSPGVPNVKSGSDQRIHVYDFGAAWCVPCRRFHPIFEKVKTNFESKANFESVDIDKGQGPQLLRQFNIQSVPTVIILNAAGTTIFRQTGWMSEGQLTAAVEKALKQ